MVDDATGDKAWVDSTEALFDQYVRRYESGDPQTIDVFCAEHPEHSAALRELLAVWQHAREGVETALLAVRHGQSSAESELVARYRERAQLFARRYRIVSSIKTGGMGAILRARDL